MRVAGKSPFPAGCGIAILTSGVGREGTTARRVKSKSVSGKTVVVTSSADYYRTLQKHASGGFTADRLVTYNVA